METLCFLDAFPSSFQDAYQLGYELASRRPWLPSPEGATGEGPTSKFIYEVVGRLSSQGLLNLNASVSS